LRGGKGENCGQTERVAISREPVGSVENGEDGGQER